MLILKIYSKTWGEKEVLIDEEDLPKLKDLNLLLWTSNRCNTFYVRVLRKSKEIKLHRLILGITNPKVIIDHINGNGLDNRKCNLRIATFSGNSANSRMYSSNKTGYRGVYLRDSGRYRACIRVNNKLIHLGSFDTKEEAAKAYNVVAKKYHGEFAVLNNIESER